MKTFTQEQLNQILAEHKLWVGSTGLKGKRAYLDGANLKKADFSGVNLSAANFQGADLSGANLRGARLNVTNLQGANLRGAVLAQSFLGNAMLQGAKMPEPNARLGEVCLYESKPHLFLKEDKGRIELLGADGKMVSVPVWYKWSRLERWNNEEA